MKALITVFGASDKENTQFPSLVGKRVDSLGDESGKVVLSSDAYRPGYIYVQGMLAPGMES